MFDDDLLEQMAPDVEADPEALEERHLALRQCLKKLRQQDRDLLHHRYASGSPLSEYAAATRRSPGTLKAILFNLRSLLRRCIERQLQDPPLP